MDIVVRINGLSVCAAGLGRPRGSTRAFGPARTNPRQSGWRLEAARRCEPRSTASGSVRVRKTSVRRLWGCRYDGESLRGHSDERCEWTCPGLGYPGGLRTQPCEKKGREILLTQNLVGLHVVHAARARQPLDLRTGRVHHDEAPAHEALARVLAIVGERVRQVPLSVHVVPRGGA